MSVQGIANDCIITMDQLLVCCSKMDFSLLRSAREELANDVTETVVFEKSCRYVELLLTKTSPTDKNQGRLHLQ